MTDAGNTMSKRDILEILNPPTKAVVDQPHLKLLFNLSNLRIIAKALKSQFKVESCSTSTIFALAMPVKIGRSTVINHS